MITTSIIVILGIGSYVLSKFITSKKKSQKKHRCCDLLKKQKIHREREKIQKQNEAEMSIFNNVTDETSIDASIYRLQANDYKLKSWYVNNIRRLRQNQQ